MAQILYRDGSDAPATEVLTVADLLSRHAPVPVKDDEPETGGISVGALLRREGRAPRAADRPLQPRPHQERADEEVGTGRRALVRRGATPERLDPTYGRLPTAAIGGSRSSWRRRIG